MSRTYDHIKGKIILHAQASPNPCVTSQEGQGDKVASLLKVIRDYSNSDKEPGCLTYRVTRSGNDFLIFEEYADGAAIRAHFETEGFKNLVNEMKTGTLAVGDSNSQSSFKLTFHHKRTTMAESFEHFTGRVITHALFTVEEGHADEIAKALKSVQEYALSDKEPGKPDVKDQPVGLEG
ncbi:Antibiotic biosynthesis monooxygenase [Rhizoctonia solani]|uniref:Antibiotic biosynthesis monooxygenase n=2 Tax=Rhizoctonia solani TaxID=456999 RepID=A0A8H7HH03_9AGAM|nr:Antibiotic biosynthesis monooxygenase [Rhizoctonia solani]